METHCVALTAIEPAIMARSRERIFDPDERARIRRIIAEGYGARPFRGPIAQSGRRNFRATVAELAEHCRARPSDQQTVSCESRVRLSTRNRLSDEQCRQQQNRVAGRGHGLLKE